jgi:hypothetical protein
MKKTVLPKVDFEDGKILVKDKKAIELGVIWDLIVSTIEETGEESHIKVIARMTAEEKLQLVVLFPSGVEQILATEL